MIVSGVESWAIGLVLLKLGLRPVFILNTTLCHGYELMIISGVGYCSFGLALLKLGLRTSFILYNKSLLFLDCDAGALDLSF